MPKVKGFASFGAKLKVKSPLLDEFENISPSASIGAEYDLPDINPDTGSAWTEDELVERSARLYLKCRKFVQDQIEEDILNSKGKGKKNA